MATRRRLLTPPRNWRSWVSGRCGYPTWAEHRYSTRFGHLLSATNDIVIATGILNLWLNDPTDVAASYASLTAAHGDRFLLGIGVSHALLIDAAESGRYRKPLAATASFLDALDDAAQPVPADARVLAALGPKMLTLAANRSRGAHPYLVTPEHTHQARELLGAGPLLLPEQTAILTDDASEARAIGTDWLRMYLAIPNYANSLLRVGFSPDDVASVSDRLLDAIIAWGDEESVIRRVTSTCPRAQTMCACRYSRPIPGSTPASSGVASPLHCNSEQPDGPGHSVRARTSRTSSRWVWGCRNANRPTVSPSHFVGGMNAT